VKRRKRDAPISDRLRARRCRDVLILFPWLNVDKSDSNPFEKRGKCAFVAGKKNIFQYFKRGSCLVLLCYKMDSLDLISLAEEIVG